jgi:hypothetical protein
MATLIISSAEGVPLGALEQNNGQARITSAADAFRNTLERWMKMGVPYQTGPKHDPTTRVSRPEDPEFLSHIVEYLKGQSDLRCSLV